MPRCPLPTRNIAVNTANRDRAIKAFDYGPPNPALPSRWFWRRLTLRWTPAGQEPTEEQIAEAKSMRCGNCGVFDVSPMMLRCMPRDYPKDAYDKAAISSGAVLGYCWAHNFKCASTRTCATWVQGGPIREDRFSPLSRL
jgi:hypothetical protein